MQVQDLAQGAAAATDAAENGECASVEAGDDIARDEDEEAIWLGITTTTHIKNA